MGKSLDVICVLYSMLQLLRAQYSAHTCYIILFPETSFLQLYSATFNFCIAVEINNGNTTVKVFASLLAKHLFMKSLTCLHTITYWSIIAFRS